MRILQGVHAYCCSKYMMILCSWDAGTAPNLKLQLVDFLCCCYKAQKYMFVVFLNSS